MKKIIFVAFISMFFVAFAHAFPSEVEKDYAYALGLYQQGNYAKVLPIFINLAESNLDLESDGAQLKLAEMYEKGYGVEKDLIQAYFWYYLVADEPHEGDHGPNVIGSGSPESHDAQVRFSIKAIESVAKHMAKDQIEEAKKMALDWDFLHQT